MDLLWTSANGNVEHSRSCSWDDLLPGDMDDGGAIAISLLIFILIVLCFQSDPVSSMLAQHNGIQVRNVH